MKKILILTSKTGGGHISLAESFADRLSHYQVEIVDPQPSIIHWHYRLVSRHALWLWATEFKFGDTPERALFGHKIFTALLAKPLASLLQRSKPDLIITTYPFLSYEVTRTMKQIGIDVPLVMMLSDPNGVHNAWLTEKGAAVTFAPTVEDYDQAIAAGFEASRLHLSGWIVREQFYRTDDNTRANMMRDLNLDPKKFTVFLQGGGEGAAKFSATIESVASVDSLQVILAAGTNKALLDKFSNIPNIRAIPFTKHIAPYMACADVVMGKAGPNMLFESVTLGKPFIATAYIPGQEEVNLQFIEKHGLGWVALDSKVQHDLIESLVRQPNLLGEKVQRVEKYRQWNNERLETIMPIIEKLLTAQKH